MRILITGATGDSMPPPYAGVQNVSLLYAKAYKKFGHEVAVTFAYKPHNADDLGAGASYFFKYKSKPNKFKKFLFLIRYFFTNPFLYINLFSKYFRIYPRFSIETILYSAYGVWADKTIASFKPDIIACQTTLIQTFMVAEVAKRKKIPVVFEPYAEIHDLKMGVNKHLNLAGRDKYWTYFLNLSSLTIGMDNCSVGPLMYLPNEKVKVFYDTCDFEFYQKEPIDTKNELRDEYQLPHDKFLLAMTGAYHYRKGHDHLIKAVSLLNKRGFKDIGAVLVGGNVGKEKWISLANEEEVEDNVFFLQNLSEEKKWKLYKSIDGYCNLSNSPRSCGLDLALLEAMSCAVPIIVYDNGALPTAVPEGKNGFVVETDNIENLAEAILNLYKKTKEERILMGEESRKFASRTDINLTSKIKIEWFEEIVHNFKKVSTKLVYLANASIKDDWAHTIQIMKMCEAFSSNGMDVTLIIPKRKFSSDIEPFQYYGLKPTFKILKVPYVDIFYGNPRPIFYRIRIISFLISARIILLFKKYDVLYTREVYAGALFRNVFIERHVFLKNIESLRKFIFRRISGLIVLTSFIKERVVKLGISPDKILIAPDAVRLEDFSNNFSKNEYREKFGLSNSDHIFGYIGTLKTMSMEKGVSTAISALAFLPVSYKLFVVGGEERDIKFYKEMAKEQKVSERVIFSGKVPHKDVPKYISVCDILVAPFPENEHYSYFMSPLKIFEYMASKRPIIVTNLPSLKEVLKDEETALFVPPSNPEALAQALERLTGDSRLREKLSLNAFKEVEEKYTWEIRAKNILDFINGRI